jgi:hypothetical protein
MLHGDLQSKTTTLVFHGTFEEQSHPIPSYLWQRIDAAVGQHCLQHHQTWNVFRIDADTKIVSIALDYKRSEDKLLKVDLADFLKHDMWAHSWELIRGQACVSVDLTRAEDNPTRCACVGSSHLVALGMWPSVSCDTSRCSKAARRPERTRWMPSRDHLPRRGDERPAVRVLW